MLIGTMLVVGGSVLPSRVSAQTANELQDQFNALMGQAFGLSEQLRVLEANRQSTSSVSTLPTHRICSALYRNLIQGVQGDDVRSLQEFLRERGNLAASPTGYFGALTRAAVMSWQASEGISPAGSFGPFSRERIKRWCGGVTVVSNQLLTATPTSGTAPLTVEFTSRSTGTEGPCTSNDQGDLIYFGDGDTSWAWASSGCGYPLGKEAVTTHAYSTAGSYTAVLYKSQIACTSTGCTTPRTEKARVVITVRGSQTCTMEYAPVCGLKPIVCITTPCNPIQQTYSNRCMMSADGATLSYEGACRPTPPVPPVVSPLKHRVCSALYRDLVRGLQGDDVRSLQEFLRSQGHLTADPTGFFGAMTSEAVSRWQRAERVSEVGSFGPVSRERIRRWCDGAVTTPSGAPSVTVTVPTALTLGKPTTISWRVTNIPSGSSIGLRLVQLGNQWGGGSLMLQAQNVSGTMSGTTNWDVESTGCAPTDFPMFCKMSPGDVRGAYRIDAAVYDRTDAPLVFGHPVPGYQAPNIVARGSSTVFTIYVPRVGYDREQAKGRLLKAAASKVAGAMSGYGHAGRQIATFERYVKIRDDFFGPNASGTYCATFDVQLPMTGTLVACGPVWDTESYETWPVTGDVHITAPTLTYADVEAKARAVANAPYLSRVRFDHQPSMAEAGYTDYSVNFQTWSDANPDATTYLSSGVTSWTYRFDGSYWLFIIYEIKAGGSESGPDRFADSVLIRVNNSGTVCKVKTVSYRADLGIDIFATPVSCP